MKIKFEVSLTKNEAPYIKLSVGNSEKNKQKVNTTIQNIMHTLNLKFYSEVDIGKSNLHFPKNGSYKIHFTRTSNVQYTQVIQEMVGIIIDKVYKNPNPTICDFLNQCGLNNFELYRKFLNTFELKKPDRYIFYLRQLRNNNDLDLLNKLIMEENDFNKRSAYSFKSLNPPEHIFLTLGYIRHLEKKENSALFIPDILKAMVITYAFTQKELKASCQYMQRLQCNKNLENTKGVHIFEDKEPIKENINNTKDLEKTRCIFL